MPANIAPADKAIRTKLLTSLAPVVVFLCAFLNWLSLGSVSLIQHFQSRHWAATACTIQSNDYHLASSRPRYYTADVSFTYAFNGALYTSSQSALWPGVFFSSSEETESWLTNYPAGAPRSCLVDPAHPRQAILVSTSPLAAAGLAVLALAVTLILEHIAILVIGSIYRLNTRRNAAHPTPDSAPTN